MARIFDSKPIFNFIPSFWRDYYQDRPELARLWEGMVRAVDDDWAQGEQVDDASNVWTCPDFIYHTYLHRDLTNWKSYGVQHFHYRKDFRAAAGQQIFYMGAWDTLDLAVFIDGKELHPVSDPFVVTQLQDATQPGVNPAGSRLIFDSPRVLNQPISVFSRRELFYTGWARLPEPGRPTFLADGVRGCGVRPAAHGHARI